MIATPPPTPCPRCTGTCACAAYIRACDNERRFVIFADEAHFFKQAFNFPAVKTLQPWQIEQRNKSMSPARRKKR